MKILLLGAGNIGKAIAHDLSKDFQITIGDIDEEYLEDVEKYGNTRKVNAADHTEILESIEDHDLIIDSLPGKFGFRVLEAAIEAEKDVVSVSFMAENPLQLDEDAREAGVTIIPDAGFGPGLPNICIGLMDSIFDEFEKATIFIGGLPKEPRPPLYYRKTWSLEGLIEEYTREARILKNNEIIKVDPFEEIRDIKINDFEFEGFLSDGLRTLTTTIDIPEMKEWTLRWEGHLEKMKILRELGFFEDESVETTLDVIRPHMCYDSKDFSIMKVEGKGIEDGREKEIKYYLYDEEKEFTSMARTTGFTTAVIVRTLIEEDFSEGVLPLECFDCRVSEKVLSELKKRDIIVEKQIIE